MRLSSLWFVSLPNRPGGAETSMFLQSRTRFLPGEDELFDHDVSFGPLKSHRENHENAAAGASEDAAGNLENKTVETPLSLQQADRKKRQVLANRLLDKQEHYGRA